MMTTNIFVIANVKKLRTGGSFRILLPFFQTSWGVGILNSAIFNSFHNQGEFGMILEGLRNFGGGLNTSTPPPPRYTTGLQSDKGKNEHRFSQQFAEHIPAPNSYQLHLCSGF